MKRILGTLVVVALVLGSSSALAAPVQSSKAMEVRQAADRAIERPTFIRTAIDSVTRMWDSIVKAIGGQDGESSVKAEAGITTTKQDAIIIAPVKRKAVGGQD